jgi:HEAT repeat protein
MRPLALSLLCGCLLLAACGKPSDAPGWARRAAETGRTEDKLEALAQARTAPGDRKAAVPFLLQALKESKAARVRAEAAMILGEFGDPAAVPGLVEAVSPDANSRDGYEVNRKVAGALGELRVRTAVPVLLRLTASPDAYTQVAAVDALGRIGDAAAVDTLAGVATSPAVEPLTAQHALLALGQIGDAKAAPVVLKMLFAERPGVSFFPQAAFAAAQIGRPMAAPLVGVLEGKDTALAGWARENKVLPGALYAKAAKVLGQVGGDDAVPALIARLGYTDDNPDYEYVVRTYAADSLGRLRAKDAVKRLSELVTREQVPAARDCYAEALAWIGDPGALAALRVAAGAGEWPLQAGPLNALSRLGGAGEKSVVESAVASCGAACPRAQADALAGMRARLEAAAACQDLRCWAGKLVDPSAPVRDRAALEVGRTGGAGEARALADAVLRPVATEADLDARNHAVLALGWVSARAPLGAAGAGLGAELEKLIAAERGRRFTEKVNEDVLRLSARLQRAR